METNASKKRCSYLSISSRSTQGVITIHDHRVSPASKNSMEHGGVASQRPGLGRARPMISLPPRIFFKQSGVRLISALGRVVNGRRERSCKAFQFSVISRQVKEVAKEVVEFVKTLAKKWKQRKYRGSTQMRL